ncbi:hypothetical protein, partial [Rhodanobacter spathiphylli]|uniref:hypothetical protein n=1 Tax=Rhodanobacter spathiphylli TaxID=347483 RepID=UPI001EE655D2
MNEVFGCGLYRGPSQRNRLNKTGYGNAAGQRLHRNGKDCTIGGYAAIKFRAQEAACKDCPLRTKCLRKPQT